MEMEVSFLSRPAPQPSQLTWQLGDLQLGVGEENDQFVAHPLETEEDLVTARLTVKNLTLEDSALDFHL